MVPHRRILQTNASVAAFLLGPMVQRCDVRTLALCIYMCTAAATDTVAPAEGLASALRRNRVANPEQIDAELTALELDSKDREWLSDLRALDVEEWAEMIAGLV